MNYFADRNAINAGDTVWVTDALDHADPVKLTVTKSGSRDITLSDGSVWSRAHGTKRGASSSRYQSRLITEEAARSNLEHRAANKKHNTLVNEATDKLRQLQWLNDSQLERIIAIASEPREA